VSSRPRIYVAAPLPLLAEAKIAAAWLLAEGYTVASSWHAGSPTVEAERAADPEALQEAARTCAAELFRIDVLVLLTGPETTRHGSVLEAGVALGRGLPVVVVQTTKGAPLPTILLPAFLRCHLPACTLAELGSGGLARWVDRALRHRWLPVVDDCGPDGAPGVDP